MPEAIRSAILCGFLQQLMTWMYNFHFCLSAISKGPANLLDALFITSTTIPDESNLEEHVVTEEKKALVRCL
jgi:hypothetical protein